MENIVLKPKKAELTAASAGLAALSVIMLAVPQSSLLLAFAIPLLACPLVGHRRQEPLAWLSICIPAAAAGVAGFGLPLALCLLLPGALPMGLTKLLRSRKRMDPADMLWYMCAAASAAAAVLAALTHALDGAVAPRIADMVVGAVEASGQKTALLYQLAAYGLVSVPAGYGQSGVLGPLMENAHSQQMLLSLHLTVENLVVSALPSLCVQVSLITGLFTCLRMQRMNGVVVVVETSSEKPAERKAHVSAPPGFRLFFLPRAVRWTVIGLGLLGLMLKTGGGTLEWTLGTMAGAVFETMLRLEGAAIVVFMFAAHDEDRALWGGVLACAMYLLAPGLLLAVSLLEPMFHFRSKRADNPDEE